MGNVEECWEKEENKPDCMSDTDEVIMNIAANAFLVLVRITKTNKWWIWLKAERYFGIYNS